jgi:hypothetical protein
MAEPTDKPPPNLTERAQDAQRARRQREAEALRANLRRRKARTEDAPADKGPEPHG